MNTVPWLAWPLPGMHGHLYRTVLTLLTSRTVSSCLFYLFIKLGPPYEGPGKGFCAINTSVSRMEFFQDALPPLRWDNDTWAPQQATILQTEFPPAQEVWLWIHIIASFWPPVLSVRANTGQQGSRSVQVRIIFGITGESAKCSIKWTVSGGAGVTTCCVVGRGKGRRLRASALTLSFPGTNINLYRYPCRVNAQRCIRAEAVSGMGLPSPSNPNKGLWSVVIVNSPPKTYLLNFVTPKTTARASLSNCA